MTKLTKNGVTTTNTPGQEQYEVFFAGVGRRQKKMVEYDYRHTDGELFSCVKLTLAACRAARDEWLSGKTE